MTSGYITTQDGTEIFYKDWGPKTAQPIVFHHGWPLSADDWDAQMMFFLGKGYRVIAHDRRGHGRSTQTDLGNEMDTYAADVIALAKHLDLKNAFHVGHSTGGGEVAHYVARAEAGRVAKAVLVGAVPPLMLKTDANPGGLPLEVFDGFRNGTAFNRAQFFRDVAAGPFYGFNRDGAKVSEGVIDNWWRQGMQGRRQGAVRLHGRLLGDRLHRRPEGDRRAGSGAARRGRPGRADRRLGPGQRALGQHPAADRVAQQLQIGRGARQGVGHGPVPGARSARRWPSRPRPGRLPAQATPPRSPPAASRASMGVAHVVHQVADRLAFAQHQLAADQVDGLDAVGALVDRGDAGVAIVLGRAGLLDEAHAAVDLHALRGHLDADVGRPGLGDRGQQLLAQLGGRRARLVGAWVERSAATAVDRQMPRAASILAFISTRVLRMSGWS
jgi:pimeloyl-ACP methyl ester carboxylesterase